MRNNLYLKKTSLLILLLTILLSAIIIFFITSKSWFLLAIPFYFYGVSFIGYIYLDKQNRKSPAKFISTYLLVSTLKLFLHLAIILTLLFTCNQKVLLAILFLINYFVFSFYEVISWIKSTQKS
jgi:hypothetical protein